MEVEKISPHGGRPIHPADKVEYIYKHQITIYMIYRELVQYLHDMVMFLFANSKAILFATNMIVLFPFFYKATFSFITVIVC
jgi:hypothetical protein